MTRYIALGLITVWLGACSDASSDGTATGGTGGTDTGTGGTGGTDTGTGGTGGADTGTGGTGGTDTGTAGTGGTDTGTAGTGGTGTSSIEVAGLWESEWGGAFNVSESAWGKNAVSKYDNDNNFAVVQLPDDDDYYPNKFSKYVWTEPEDGQFYYCTVDFGLDTSDEAENTEKVADATDPADSGCGDFPWTRYFRAIEVYGMWNSEWGPEDITTGSWAGVPIVKFDNEENFAILQNPGDAEYYANKFSKVVWTETADNAFHYCTVDFGLDTADEAENTEKVADATDPDAAGCGDFSWTKLVAE